MQKRHRQFRPLSSDLQSFCFVEKTDITFSIFFVALFFLQSGLKCEYLVGESIGIERKVDFIAFHSVIHIDAIKAMDYCNKPCYKVLQKLLN